MSASILVVDDEEAIVSSLGSILQDEGYEVAVAKSGVEALKIYTVDPPDLMLLDIWMPEMDGLETLRRVKELVPTAQVMVMSGHGSIETAVKAIKLGAYDYIEKPLSLENVTLRVKHALEQFRLEEENRSLRTKVQRKFELVGQSPAMQQLRQLIDTAGPTNSRVLDRWRERDRQRIGGTCDSSSERSSGPSVRGGQLRRDPRNPDRERAVRARKGIV